MPFQTRSFQGNLYEQQLYRKHKYWTGFSLRTYNKYQFDYALLDRIKNESGTRLEFPP